MRGSRQFWFLNSADQIKKLRPAEQNPNAQFARKQSRAAHVPCGSDSHLAACPRHVSFTPNERTSAGGPDMSEKCQERTHAPQQNDCAFACYSITSSARASSVGGTSRPSALAVCRLMTNSNLVDCSTGRSAGLAPLRI